MNIQRTHKGERIKPSDHQPSFTPWVGTGRVATQIVAGREWVCPPDVEGATVRDLSYVGVCFVDGHGRECDEWRMPLADWDDLVAQVERLRRQAGEGG